MNEGTALTLNQKTTNFAVPYDEEIAGYSESWAVDAAQMNRRCQVSWANSTNFVRDMIGYPTLSGGSILRVLPNAHPSYPNLYCTSCGTSQYRGTYGAGGGGAIKYDYLVYDCKYEGLPYKVLSDVDATTAASAANVLNAGSAIPELMRYTEKTRTFQANQIVLPNTPQMWKFSGASNTPVNTGGTVLTYEGEITYTWHQVPGIPFSNIQLCIGKINNAIFDVDPQFCPAGFAKDTLLFVGADYRLSPSNPKAAVVGGSWYYDIIYKFLLRQDGWNKFFYPTDPNNPGGAPGFYPVVSAQDGVTTPYKEQAITVLWSFL